MDFMYKSTYRSIGGGAEAHHIGCCSSSFVAREEKYPHKSFGFVFRELSLWYLVYVESCTVCVF